MKYFEYTPKLQRLVLEQSLQGSIKLSPVDHLVDGILVLVQKGWYKKEVMPKKKVCVARNLKD